MSLRFRRSIRIAPGVHVNLGLHGAGLSVGPRGLHVGVNRRGMYTSGDIGRLEIDRSRSEYCGIDPGGVLSLGKQSWRAF